MVDQWKRVGYRLGDRRATFRGWRIHGELFDDDWVTRERRFSSFQLTDEYLYKIWPKLHDYRPGFVHAYPSTAMSMCQFMEKTHAKLPETIRAFLIGSENIYDGQKEYIEAVSGRRCFCWYGHSEKLILAGECEKTSFYHAYPQYGYVEFINERGMPAAHGEFAEIVGTGFMNTVMPFIRYRTGDFCTYLGERCPSCGRNYPMFEKVRGRWTQEVLYGKSGNPICMSAINVHSSNFFNVFRFQFCQERVGEAVLKIVPKHGFSKEERQAIERELNEKFSGNVVITCQTVDEIPLTQRAKYKFIDQRIQLAPARAHA
jgi:phenylacetate-CoA ligase